MLENIYRSGLYELLKVFYNNRFDYLHFNKIVELSSLGRGSVDRYLKILINDKILVAQKDANLVKYKLNDKNSIALSLLMNFDKERIEKLPLNVRKILNDIRGRIDCSFMFIFGSFAKGNFSKNSDLDIFIAVKDKSLIKEYDFVKKLEMQYGVKIDLQISTLNIISDNQKHIIKTGLPFCNGENFYEVFFNLK
jgi:predicted nucleotidyltransferase